MRIVHDLRYYLQLLGRKVQFVRHLAEDLITPVRSELLVRGMNRPHVGGDAADQRAEQEDHHCENRRFTAYLSVFHDSFPPSSIKFRRDYRVDCPRRRPGRAIEWSAVGPHSPSRLDVTSWCRCPTR